MTDLASSFRCDDSFGHVVFKLLKPTSQDVGMYSCREDSLSGPLVADCGQTLHLLGERELVPQTFFPFYCFFFLLSRLSVSAKNVKDEKLPAVMNIRDLKRRGCFNRI